MSPENSESELMEPPTTEPATEASTVRSLTVVARTNNNYHYRKVPLDAVSKRKRRIIRESGINIWYYFSIGSDAISAPPDLPASHGLEVNDIYIHRRGQQLHQAWRCAAVSPHASWVQLVERKEYDVQGQKRYFIVTETGLPSWVQHETIDRQYGKARK